MGKIMESLGVIDGYDITTVGKFKAKKDEFFEEIEKYDSKIKEETRKLAESSSGQIYAIVKKGKIYGLYLFEAVKEGDKNSLKHIKTVYSDEVTEDTRGKYDEHILDIAKEYVTYQEYDKVTLNDKVVQLDPKVSKKERILSLIGGFLIGFILGWTIMDEFIWGFIFGIGFAPIFSGLEAVVTKKRGKKKKEDN